MIDLKKDDLRIVKEILRKYVPNLETRVFGSRATGKADETSDLDLVILAPHKLPFRTLSDLKYAFEESDLPFRVDVLDWRRISGEFREQIQKEWETVQIPADKI